MRIINEKVAGNGTPRIVMATGVEEILLMLGILERARLNYPVGDKWRADGNRLKNITKELKRALAELTEKGGELDE